MSWTLSESSVELNFVIHRAEDIMSILKYYPSIPDGVDQQC
jgi:hypothetical protein